MKKVLIGIFLCLVPVFVASLVIGGPTYTNRERLKSAPMHIDYKSGDTDWALKVTDSADVQRWRVQHDGTKVGFNASGATVWGINGADGKPILGTKASYVSGVSMRGVATGNTSYSMTTAHDLYIFTVSGGSYPAFLPAQISGVSVYMPTGSAALDGFKLHVAAHPMSTYYSGTSDICFVPANDSVQSKGVTDFIVSLSGITVSTASANVFAHDLIDNEAETVTFVYEWATSGGTWWQVDIQ